MCYSNRRWNVFSLLACLALAFGCTPALWAQDPGRKPRPAGEDEEQQIKVLDHVEHDKGLMIEVLEIRRDAQDQLYIRWRYRNPTDKAIRLLAQSNRYRVKAKQESDPEQREEFLEMIWYEGEWDGTVGPGECPDIERAVSNRGMSIATKGKDRNAKVIPKQGVVVGPKEAWEFWAWFEAPAKARCRKLKDGQLIRLHLPNSRALMLIAPKVAQK
jgi:hypothetical protein